MGLTQKLGTIPLAIFTDASNNIGIGGSPSGSFKLEVTGTGRFSGELSTTSGLLSISGAGGGPPTGGVGFRFVSNRLIVYGGSSDITFQKNSNAGANMTILESGNVGIGTTSPTHNLEIANPSGSTYIKLNADFGIGYIGMETADDSMRFVTAQATPIQFYTANTERMRIFASGNVRFSSVVYNNSVASPRTLFIASDGELGGQVSVRASKINIESFNTNWLYDLKPVQFNYRKKDENNEYTQEFYSELFYGLIAEETELVNKELCNYNENKLIGIEYSKLVPVLVKAIQELNQQNQDLKSRLDKAGL